MLLGTAYTLAGIAFVAVWGIAGEILLSPRR